MATLALQVTASVMAGMAVNSALKYERALRSVFTLFKDAGSASAEMQQAFQNMDATIRGISTRTKTTPTQLAEGLYDVVSTGFDAASGAIVLENAARGAYAGLTDVNTVTALLTQTLQAYRQEGEDSMDLANRSGRMLDMFFNAVNVGVFTFEELAEKFGDVASSAAAFGVPLEDLLAFLSTATVRGIGLDEAITAARQTLLSIASATPQSKEALAALFGSLEEGEKQFSATALAEQGLIGVMRNLSAVVGTKIDRRMIEIASAMEEDGGDAAGFLAEKIGISVEAFTDLFPNIRALKGVLAVQGPGLETYGEHFETIANNMGAVDRAAKEIDKSASGALQGLKAVWEQFKIDVGNIALPWIKNIADGLVEWWGGLPERFAREQGFEPGPVSGDSILERSQGERTQIERFWAGAAPGEKIGFILRTAWSDALTSLSTWFDGEGKGKVESIGEKVGKFIGEALMSIAGVEGQDIESNVFYKIGQAAFEGFKAGFTASFEGGDFFGGLFGGDNVLGNLLMGYGALKLLPKFLRTGTGTAAGTGAAGTAAGAAGSGMMARLFGTGAMRIPAAAGIMAIIGAIQEGAAGDFFRTALGQQPFQSTVHSGKDEILSGIRGTNRPTPSGEGLAGLVQSAQGIESGAGSIKSAGGQMRSASITMMAAANRMANIRVSVTGGRYNGSSSDPRMRYAADGFEGRVTRPTLFMTGEDGSEDVSIAPHGKRNRGGGGVTINMGGITVGSRYDVKQMVSDLKSELQRAFANG